MSDIETEVEVESEVVQSDLDEVHNYLIGEWNNAKTRIAQLEMQVLTLTRERRLLQYKIGSLQEDLKTVDLLNNGKKK